MRRKQKDLIKEISDKELIFHAYFTQILLLTISIILGIFLIRDLSTFAVQFQYTPKIIYIGISSGLIIVALDLLLMKIVPPNFYDDGGINERIFSNQSIVKIILISLMIAFSEELLFRGIVQYKFGLIWASIIFAIIHIRYWSHWYLILNVLILSFVIGYVYQITGNLWVTIMMHFTIDCLLGFVIRLKSIKSSKEEGMLDGK